MAFGIVSKRRLRTRLIFWTTTIVVLAVGGSFELRTRVTASMIERDIEDRSQTLVRAAVRTVGDEADTMAREALESRLQDFVDADPAMSRMHLYRSDGGRLVLVAETSENPSPLEGGPPPPAGVRIEQQDASRVLITAERVAGTDFWIVAATSLEGLDRYLAVNRVWAAVFSIGVILLLVALLGFLFDRLISRRFSRLIFDLSRAEEEGYELGNEPDDEIGVLAGMFGQLLARVRSLNEDLQVQVTEATESLHRRNRALEETTQELLSMQRKVLQSERLATVGQMAATFAHEVGSPLSSLSAHIQLLLEEPDLPDGHRETVETIRGEIQSLVQIVNELLRTARHGPDDFVPVDMNEVTRSVLRLVDPKLRSQSIRVTSRLKPVPPVRGYPLYLQEVLLNLINNASEAMPSGGNLDVDVRYDRPSDRVRIRIADTGPGIDPAIVERIFDSFVTTRDLGTGTGLGLAIVREIMASHNGTVELASNNGRGTQALLSIPSLGGERANGNLAHSDR